MIDPDNNVVAGHGRIEAAKYLNMVEVPTIRVGHLNAAQIQALALADNRLHDQSNWNDDCLVGPRPRSVLTGKVAGEEDGDVERDRVAGAL